MNYFNKKEEKYDSIIIVKDEYKFNSDDPILKYAEMLDLTKVDNFQKLIDDLKEFKNLRFRIHTGDTEILTTGFGAVYKYISDSVEIRLANFGELDRQAQEELVKLFLSNFTDKLKPLQIEKVFRLEEKRKTIIDEIDKIDISGKNPVFKKYISDIKNDLKKYDALSQNIRLLFDAKRKEGNI